MVVGVDAFWRVGDVDIANAGILTIGRVPWIDDITQPGYHLRNTACESNV